MTPEVTSALSTMYNPYFDTSEVQSLLQGSAPVLDNPRLATTGSIGAVKQLTDPGTLPADATLPFVIAYLNALRDAFIAALMMDASAGGGS